MIITVNCAEEQPHSYKETCNSIAFDGVRPCECECHTGQNIIHFVECCHPGLARAIAPYNGIYYSPPVKYVKEKKEKKMKANQNDGDCIFCAVENEIRLITRIDDPVQQSIFMNKIKSNSTVKPSEIGLKTFGENYLDYFNEISNLLNEMVQNHRYKINNSVPTINQLFYTFFAFLEFRYEVMGFPKKPEIAFMISDMNYIELKKEMETASMSEVLQRVPEA